MSHARVRRLAPVVLVLIAALVACASLRKQAKRFAQDAAAVASAAQAIGEDK